ncbi:GntR family transcriptional regulator [Streptosporangium minutum]|uniref:GntR family transcriptional regulator n=1 Tax=Streptosporangium minutum TaxID=569862 RepID=UPI003BF95FD2
MKIRSIASARRAGPGGPACGRPPPSRRFRCGRRVVRCPPGVRRSRTAARRSCAASPYTPGAPLPSETALSARYSVSRPTVRDAVKALVGEGLVSVVRGRGTFVRAVPDRHAILLGTWPRHDIADPEFIPTARQ